MTVITYTVTDNSETHAFAHIEEAEEHALDCDSGVVPKIWNTVGEPVDTSIPMDCIPPASASDIEEAWETITNMDLISHH